MHSYNTIISAKDLARIVGQTGLVLFDARFSLQDTSLGRNLYDQGHLPGAHYADLDKDLSRLDKKGGCRHPLPSPDEFCHFLGRAGVTPNSQIVTYDSANSAMAARLWWLCKWVGHENVAVLDGGYQAWVNAGLPTSKDSPSTANRSGIASDNAYPGSPNPKMIFSTETIEKGIGQEGFVLVDAREPVRFRGETEPIDPVAGHIPGAVNIPFMGSLDESNRFLPPELLRKRFEIAKHATHPAMMCGSGVTACHNVLAYEIAYGQRPPLYAGSWSEWIADRSRPVATGP